MKRDYVVKAIRARHPELRALGVRAIHLFGSTARNEASDLSDIDLIVSFDGPPTFSRFMDVKFLLEKELGRKIDLTTPDGLKPSIRSKIEKESVLVS